MSWVRIADVAELPKGGLLAVERNGEQFAVCQSGGTVTVLEGTCPHQGAQLGQGNLVDGYVVCPWHAWEFHCQTGKLAGNERLGLRVYPTRIENGGILIEQESSA